MARSRLLVSSVALAGVAALTLAGCSSETSSDEDDTAAAPMEGGDLALTIGTALPQTGDLAFLGPPEEAGVAYAQSLINEYTEETGLDLEIVWGDSGDLSNRAFETEIPRLLGEDVSAIVGAASSGVSLQFIDEVVGAGVIQFSPANTSDAFTTYEDDGLYFRTAPSDVLQGEVLGNFIAEEGHQTLGMIVLNDAYGTGLANYITEAFEAAGGEVVAAPTFNPGDTTFTSQVSEVLAEDPDAIVVLTFDQAKTIVPNLVDEGVAAEQMYFVDGNLADYSADFPEGTLEGAKGTYPGPTPEQVQAWVDDLNVFVEEDGRDALTDYTYGPESYDAVNLLALAALQAQSTDGAAIAAELQEISGGSGEGETCTTFADCADIILGGGTADYDGISSPVTFDDVGDPTEGIINIYEYGADNTYAAYTG
ncbi:ABC transporter substrate-binding protein [Microbacterium sp. ZXX196]|uniref:ABC transporter substrate-binding protein n=1 Tax=Microbacterium sp. ZXX196 TaxID=2609291 RepID=UPI0012B74CA1|nr:ABC transporter substrate-binding protein [Microbacterium sp. ZXX196]MTE24557.1 ABC transporter substrate-binding protein [Microbacterium sp. ZXX196]